MVADSKTHQAADSPQSDESKGSTNGQPARAKHAQEVARLNALAHASDVDVDRIAKQVEDAERRLATSEAQAEQAAAAVPGEAPSDEVLPDNIGVLATYRNTGDRVADALNAAGIPAKVVRNQTRSTASKKNSVQVMTMHRAKGLEFTHVVVVPGPKRPGWDPEETRRRDRSLEYVAMTRARDELVVVRRA